MREAFSPEAVEDLLREMPPFEDKRRSALELRLMQTEGEDSAAVTKASTPSDVEQQRALLSAHMLSNPPMDDDDEIVPINEQTRDALAAGVVMGAGAAILGAGAMRDEGESSEGNKKVNDVVDQQYPVVVGIPKELIPAMRKAFSNLCTNPSGVLFENSLLQVGVKHEYIGAQGRISVFFGNLHSSPLENFRVEVDQPDHLRMQMQGTQDLLDDGESDSPGCTVATKTQAKLLILVEVTAPFVDAPSIRIKFLTKEGEVHDYPLRLPLVVTSFMEPVNLDPGAFMQRWKSLEGPERECQEVLKLSPASSGIDEGYMYRVANVIVDGLKFGRCKGVDPTPWTVSAAGTFRTGAKDMNGNNINVGCLVRIEANPKANAFRVTTRTLHPLCSKAIKNIALVSIKLAA